MLRIGVLYAKDGDRRPPMPSPPFAGANGGRGDVPREVNTIHVIAYDCTTRISPGRHPCQDALSKSPPHPAAHLTAISRCPPPPRRRQSSLPMRSSASTKTC